jgi:predicted alpha/beta-hydrolase family hydrolase
MSCRDVRRSRFLRTTDPGPVLILLGHGAGNPIDRASASAVFQALVSGVVRVLY